MFPDCDAMGSVDDTLSWTGLPENTEDINTWDQIANVSCTVTAVADSTVSFDCLDIPDMTTGSEPTLSIEGDTPITLPFAVDDQVNLHLRGYLGWQTWVSVVDTDPAVGLLLGTVESAPGFEADSETDWLAPLSVGTDSGVCPDVAGTIRLAAAVDYNGATTYVTDHNEALIDDAYLVRVSSAKRYPGEGLNEVSAIFVKQ
jgi:hypothetical protein